MLYVLTESKDQLWVKPERLLTVHHQQAQAQTKKLMNAIRI